MAQRLTKKALHDEIHHLEENELHMEHLGLPWEARKMRKRIQELLEKK